MARLGAPTGTPVRTVGAGMGRFSGGERLRANVGPRQAYADRTMCTRTESRRRAKGSASAGHHIGPSARPAGPPAPPCTRVRSTEFSRSMGSPDFPRHRHSPDRQGAIRATGRGRAHSAFRGPDGGRRSAARRVARRRGGARVQPCFIGLMSGTSLDGVDGVVAQFASTPKEPPVRVLAHPTGFDATLKAECWR